MTERAKGDAETLDVIARRAKEQLNGWSEADRTLFSALWSQTGGELKRELLRRALAQGHSPAEMRAFAEALKPLNEQEAFAACTLTPAQALYESVSSRLAAESDPVYAWVLNGYPLAVALTGTGTGTGMGTTSARPLARPHGAAPSSASKRMPRLTVVAESACRVGEDLFSAAGAPFGLAFSEQSVDQGGLTLEEALLQAADALSHGIPIPVLFGAEVGEYTGYALLLDVQSSGAEAVYALYEVMQDKVAFLRLADVREALPWFVLSSGRMRITAIALPGRATT